MIARLAAAAVALVLVIGGATACQPDPEPTPSGPVFATEDEAFAAAEETYRAYVDALNQVDLSDPETFEAVYAWTTGDANANERETLSQMHADGWAVSGETAMTLFVPGSVELGGPVALTATICSDVSDVDVLDASGQSVVSTSRPDVYALQVDFVESESTSTGLAISASNAVEAGPCN